jgi:transposase-like protein
MAEKSDGTALESTDIQRWTAKRKAAAVLEIIKGKTTAAQVARQHALTTAEVEGWVDVFLRGGEEQLRSNPRDQAVQHEAERKELHAKIGEMALQIDVLKKASAILERASRGENL